MIARAPNAQAPTPFFRQLVAALGVALVLLLSASSASPVLHELLHQEDAHETSDRCAVVLFASGVALASAALAVLAPVAVWLAVSASRLSELFLVAPHYLRQPERGPPLR